MDLVPIEKEYCSKFSEKHTLQLLKEMDQVKIKVYATLTDTSGSGEPSERLISCLLYKVGGGELLDMFDQKPRAKRLGDSKCKVLFQVRWLHSADMQKLDQYKAELDKKYKQNESLRLKAQTCENQLERAQKMLAKKTIAISNQGMGVLPVGSLTASNLKGLPQPKKGKIKSEN